MLSQYNNLTHSEAITWSGQAQRYQLLVKVLLRLVLRWDTEGRDTPTFQIYSGLRLSAPCTCFRLSYFGCRLIQLLKLFPSLRVPVSSSVTRVEMLSLPLSIRSSHSGRLSATVKCYILSLALVASCALFASVPSYLREGPIDFKAPTYPAVADVSTCIAASSS